MQKLNKELATEIKRHDNGQVEKLIYIGSGTTCNVYQTESKDIIKEFAPRIRVNNEFVDLMSRNVSNGELIPLRSLSPFHLDILKEKRILFDSEISIVNELNHRYRTEEDNMFIFSSDIPQTSLGRCHWCNYVGGRTLEKVFIESKDNSLDFKQYFLNILPFIISLYDEIAFYHRDNEDNVSDNGILNLDIKPENLFAIKSQGDYIGIRNLDFGSLRRIDDKYDNGVLIESGLISLIRNYAAENKNVDINMLVSQISSKFFASSPGFYDNDRINKTILKCLNLETPIEDIVLDLKLLDILAAWKTFLFAFVESKENLILEDKFETETELIFRVFADIFENNPLSESSLFESYNIYSQLYEIMARSFKGKRKFRLTASKIADRLRNILCVLKGVPENKKTEEQRDFETMNLIYSRKDELLKSHNLTTIKDILNLCKMNNLSNEMGDIHWFLMFGEKHG